MSFTADRKNYERLRKMSQISGDENDAFHISDINSTFLLLRCEIQQTENAIFFKIYGHARIICVSFRWKPHIYEWLR